MRMHSSSKRTPLDSTIASAAAAAAVMGDVGGSISVARGEDEIMTWYDSWTYNSRNPQRRA
jgi:hypothetical protein